MKKRRLTSLKLNKESISNVKPSAVKGGTNGSVHDGKSCFFCWPTENWTLK
ncbi:MAG: hypothetical protein AAF611_18215 [Bacteroidota bacterium]